MRYRKLLKSSPVLSRQTQILFSVQHSNQKCQQKNQKKWLRYHFGKDTILPKNLEDGLPYARLLPSSNLRQHDSVDKLMQAIKGAKDQGDDIDDDEDDDDTTTTTSGVPQIAGTGPQPSVVIGPLPLIGPKLKETLMVTVLPKLTLIDPATIGKDSEIEVETFTEQTKYPYEDMLLWDHMSRLEFCRAGNGEAAAVLLGDLSREVLKKDPDLLALIIDKHHPIVVEKLSPAEEFKKRQAEKKQAKAM